MSESGINEYENVSGGWIGVKVKDESRRTGFRGHPVSPGGRVSLSEEERVATANAPRKPEDNPFANGALRLIAVDQQSTQARPIGDGEPQAPEPEPEAAPDPEAEKPSAEKPEDEMTEAEKAEHNRKAAAARAVPAREAPKSPPVTAGDGERKTPETVATPEAKAAAGGKPEGQRTADETVGTPEAQKK